MHVKSAPKCGETANCVQALGGEMNYSANEHVLKEQLKVLEMQTEKAPNGIAMRSKVSQSGDGNVDDS